MRHGEKIKVIAVITVITFLTTQIGMSAELHEVGSLPLTPLSGAVEDARAALEVEKPREPRTSTDFLSDNSPLSEVLEQEEAEEEGDLARINFETAAEELRPDYAVAVVVDRLTADDIDRLTDLSFEVGIAVLKGEIILFSSGNRDEIRVGDPPLNLLNQASFVSHTHPHDFHDSGPSALDRSSALEFTEYVISDAGIYGYRAGGEVARVEPEDYLSALRQAVREDRVREPSQVEARALLNEFIRETDLINSGQVSATESYRASELVEFTDNFDRASLGTDWAVVRGNYAVRNGTELYGYNSYPVHDGGVTLNPTLAGNDYEASVSSYFGGGLTRRGLLLRYTDARQYYYVTVDEWGRGTIQKSVPDGVAAIHSFSVGTVSAAWHKITASVEGGHFKVYFDDVLKTEFEDTAPYLTGKVGIYADVYGRVFDNFSVRVLNAAPAVVPPTVEVVPEFTNAGTVTLAGTKAAGTGIWINGAEAEAVSTATTWSHTLTLTEEKLYSFSIAARDDSGNESTAVVVETTLDQTAPVVAITSAALTNDANYMLIYTVDGAAKTKSYTLVEGANPLTATGTDAAGNTTTVSYTVVLDTIAPKIVTDSVFFQGTTSLEGQTGYWSFDDVSGGTVTDQSGSGNDGQLMNGPASNPDHPNVILPNSGSLNFDGINDYVSTTTAFTNPSEFSLSLWFKTGSATGGKLIGFGRSQTGTSTSYDRHIYMNNAGQLYFGVYPGTVKTIKTVNSYNDGAWHHVAATLSADGMQLYMDGTLAAENAAVKTAENYPGYWRIGYDNLNGWVDRPSSYYFRGLMDDVRVFERGLSAEEIQSVASGDGLGGPAPVITIDSLTVEYTVDGISKTKAFENLVQGINELRIDEVDAAGNETVLTGSVTVDLVTTIAPPTVEDIPTFTNAGTVTLAGTKAAGTGIWINGAEAVAVSAGTTWSYAVTLTEEKLYSFSITARDDSGNESTAVVVETTFDSTAPAIVFTSAQTSVRAAYTLTYTADGADKAKDFTLTEGSNTLTVTETDAAGNETTASFAVAYEPIEAEVPIVLEAENAASIASPFAVYEDWYASAGSYIGVANGGVFLKSPDINKSVTFNTTVPWDGTYYLWGRTLSPSGDDDSFYVQIDNGPVQLWDTGTHTAWEWAQVKDRSAGLFKPVLSAGEHTIRIYQREDGTFLDSLYLTDDPTYTPSGADVVSAPYPFLLTLEAENMGKTTGGPASGGWNVWSNGEVYATRNIPETSGYEIEVIARGQQGGGVWPLMSLKIDNQTIAGPDPVAVTSWNSYLFDVELVAGNRKFAVAFTNDYCCTNGDRNLYVDKIIVRQKESPDEVFMLADGTELYYKSDVLVREITPAGDEVIYRADGSTAFYRYADGREIHYDDTTGVVRRLAAGGSLVETLTLPEASALNEDEALRLTLEDGIEAFYAAGQLVEMRTETGIRITDFTLNENNEIVDALIRYPDRSLDVIREGALLRRIAADGGIMDFTPAAFVVREILADITEYHSVEKLSQTEIAATRIFTAAGDSVKYDKLGIMREVEDAAGAHFIYNRIAAENGYTLSLDRAVSSAPEAKSMTAADYAADGSVLKTVLEDGSVIEFDDGRVLRALDETGAETAGYSYAEELSFMKGLTVNRDGTDFVYDDSGFLESIVTSGGTVRRLAEDTDGDGMLNDEAVVDLLLETVGGNQLSNFELDEDGNIISGIIETKEGIKQTIENGVMTGFETVDGKIYDFANDQALLREWHFRDGTHVVYGGGAISEILFPDGSRLHTIGFDNGAVATVTEETSDGIVKVYENGTLVRLTTSDGAQIYYGREGMAERIVLPDASEQTVSYLRGEAGGLQEIQFKGEHAFRAYTPAGTLLRVLTDGVHAEMTDGEVSQLYTRFGEVENPGFDAEGILSGTLTFADATQQTIEQGVLTKTVRADGTAVLYAEGRVSGVEIEGRRYDLSYEDAADGSLAGMQLIRTFDGGTSHSLVPYLLDPATAVLGVAPRDDSYSMQGTSTIDTNNFKTGHASMRFNAGGDILSVPEPASWLIGTGDFTVDFWMQSDNFPGESSVGFFQLGSSGGTGMRAAAAAGQSLEVWIDGSVRNFTWAPQVNRWYHIALVRQSGQLKAFVDGAQIGAAVEFARNVSGASGGLSVGGLHGGAYSMQGRMDEFRVSRTARWNTGFTPGVEEYERDGDTQYLLHFLDPSYERPEPLTDPELSEILLARPAHDALADPLAVSSELDGGTTLLVSKLVSDTDRETVYEFAGEYDPEWTGVSLNNPVNSFGYIGRNHTMDVHDNLPAQTADLIDMNGDGLKDHVFIDVTANMGFWWIQYNNGNGFDSPVRWTGVDQDYGNEVCCNAHTMGALRFFEGRHPHVLGDLADMNGDGLPDRVVQKFLGEQTWYVQYNNGSGFDPLEVWAENAQPASQWSFQAAYALEVRDDGKDVQELLSDLVDIDGDGLADRIVRPAVQPFSHWFYQHNTGDGFDSAILWTGVDMTFHNDPEIAGSLSWYERQSTAQGELVADVSDLVDMDGDGRLDRVLVKESFLGDAGAVQEWYVQFNNGKGFEPAVLWDNSVRALPGVGGVAAVGVRAFLGWDEPRNVLIDIMDVTGDGLPDRVSVDANDGGTHDTWWVEVNTGSSFANPVAWSGIEGTGTRETAITQDDRNFRSYNGGGRSPAYVRKVAELTDVNGDAIPDRVLYTEGDTEWRVQLGTGSGFLPASVMAIGGIQAASSSVKSSLYDYLHVSVRAAQPVGAAEGRVKVTLGDPAEPESYQEWTIDAVGMEWADHYLPMDAGKSDADELRITFEPAGENPGIPLYVDNVTFAAPRPPAVKDWLDRMLTQEDLLAEVYSDRNETLAQYLGLSEANGEVDFDWGRLLTAETRIDFDTAGEAEEFETLYGTVSQMEAGRVSRSRLPDGTVIEFDDQTQTVTREDGTAETLDLAYGRVRAMSRAGESPLEYSYEFNDAGEEITVVYDPDTGLAERYLAERLISRTAATGVDTVYEYGEDGALLRSSIVYKGRVRQTFEHSTNDGGNRVITTEQGVREEYGEDGNILSHITPEGFRYAHSFETARDVVTVAVTETVELPDGSTFTVDVPSVSLVDNPAGEEVHRITLTGFTGPEGEEAGYEDGTLTNLRLADGTLISFDAAEADETGASILLDATVFHNDGTVTEFRDGNPYAVTGAAGHMVGLVTENGHLVNPNESAEFHQAEAEKLWQDQILTVWQDFGLPGTLPIESEYALDGELVTRRYAEGVLETYHEGRIDRVLAGNGEQLVVYSYDADGNPIRIEMGGARRRLDSAVLRLRAEIAVEREEALARVAEREQVLSQTLEGQYVVARDRLLAIRDKLEAQHGEIASIEVRGKQGKSTLGNALSQIQVGLDQVNGALEALAAQRAAALEQLAAQVAEASQQILSEAEASFAEIEAENQIARRNILQQEITPVVYHWYRKIMGRDPSQAEYAAVIATADFETGLFDLEALKQSLLTSQELLDRTAEVQTIKNNVETELLTYLLLSDTEKLAYAEALGLLPEQVVDLSAAEANAALDWVRTRSLHFGQSAYLAIEAMLARAGLEFERVELASRLILIDILTGTITPLEKDDLVISMFALRTVAAHYGLETQSFALNYDALKAIYDDTCAPDPDTCDFRLVAHVNGNHYIIVTRVTDDEISYIDPGAGAQQALDQVTMTKEEFVAIWVDPSDPDKGFGYALSQRPPPAEADPASYAALTIEKEMSVRGAFFTLLVIAFIAISQAVMAAVSATIAAIGTVLTGLISGVGSILSGFGSFFGGLFTGNFLAGLQGLFAGVLTGLGQIAGGVIGGIIEFGYGLASALGTLNATLLAPVQGFLNGIPLIGGALSGFVGSAGFNLALIGLELQGAGSLLEAVGVSPKLSRTIIAGGKIAMGIGLLATGNPLGVAASLGFVSGGTSEMLNLHTSLPPLATNLISIGAAGLAAFGGGFSGGGESIAAGLTSLQTALPHLTMDLASAGVTAAGNALGLDWRITALIGIPVMASVGGLMNGLTNGTGAGSVFNSIKDALTSGQTLGGLVSVGAAIGLDALGAPPIATNFISNFLGSIASGLAGGSSGGGGPGDIQAKGQSILSKIGEGLQKFGRGIANVVGNVVSFGQKVVEGVGNVTVQGFKKAVSAFSSIFSRQTQEGIYQDEVGLKGATVTQNGDIWTWQNGSSRIDYNTQTGEATESFGVGGSARITGLGQDEGGGIYYQKLTYETAVGGGAVLNQTFDNGKLTGWSYGIEGTPIITVKGPEDQKPWMTEDGRIFQGDVEINPSPVVIKIPDDFDPQRPTLFDNLFFKFNILDGKVAYASAEVRPGASTTVAAPTDTSKFVFGNGFNNEIVPENTPDKLMPSFVSDLATKDFIINIAKTLLVPMYETTGLVGNILDWAQDFIFKLSSASELLKTAALGITPSVLPILANALGGNDLIEEVKKKLLDFEKAKGILDKGIAFAHSGFFAPLLGALEKTRDDGSYFDVQTVINYEGPNVNWNDHIDNPNLKRIINVWGTAPNEIIETRANQIPGCNTNGSVSCIDPSKKPVVISDFGPPSNPTNLLSEWSKAGFTGSAPGGIENVNILILNARHNDFSYDATAWNDPGNQFEPEMIAQEINRKTNKFMRLLYQFSLTDQTRPGDLRFFLENTTGISFDSANQVWVVDPSQLEF